MGYTSTAARGFGWQSLLKVLIIGVGFIKIFFLARLLTPTDFGVYALVLIALGLLESTTETGINLTIIQSKKTAEYYLNTAWVISIIRGFIIGGLMAIASSIFALFFHEPQLTGLILLAALIPIIKGFINPMLGALQKEFQFSKQAIFLFVRYFVEATASVVLVLVWQSEWSLILALIVAAVTEVIASHLVLNPKPKFAYQKKQGKEILTNSRSLTLHAALVYFSENIDDLIIGKLLGPYILGLYHNGYSLAHKLLYDPTKSANHSLLPIYSKLTDDSKRVRSSFIKALILISVGLLLGLTLTHSFSAQLVTLALGNQWISLIPILWVLGLAAVLQSLFAVFATYLYAVKQYRGITWGLIIQSGAIAGFVWFLSSNYGLVGAAWALVLARLLSIIPLAHAILRHKQHP